MAYKVLDMSAGLRQLVLSKVSSLPRQYRARVRTSCCYAHMICFNPTSKASWRAQRCTLSQQNIASLEETQQRLCHQGSSQYRERRKGLSEISCGRKRAVVFVKGIVVGSLCEGAQSRGVFNAHETW